MLLNIRSRTAELAPLVARSGWVSIAMTRGSAPVEATALLAGLPDRAHASLRVAIGADAPLQSKVAGLPVHLLAAAPFGCTAKLNTVTAAVAGHAGIHAMERFGAASADAFRPGRFLVSREMIEGFLQRQPGVQAAPAVTREGMAAAAPDEAFDVNEVRRVRLREMAGE